MKANHYDVLKKRILKVLPASRFIDQRLLLQPAQQFEKVRSIILGCTHYEQTLSCHSLICSYQRINGLSNEDASVKILLDILRVKAESLNMPVWTSKQTIKLISIA